MRFTIRRMSHTPRPQLAHLTAALDDLRARGTYFRLRVLDDQQAPVCHYDGRRVINLASNNYLGLCNHPKLREAAIAATQKYGVRLRSRAHHRRHHAHPHGARRENRRLQERRGLRGLPVRLCRQRRHRLRHPRQGRLHPLRRAQPRLDHRRRAPVAGEDQGLPPQGRRPRRRVAARDPARARPQAPHHRRRLLHGRRHRPRRRVSRPGSQIRRHHDGRRRARLRCPRPQRSRQR
jgi:hypothetical protein